MVVEEKIPEIFGYQVCADTYVFKPLLRNWIFFNNNSSIFTQYAIVYMSHLSYLNE